MEDSKSRGIFVRGDGGVTSTPDGFIHFQLMIAPHLCDSGCSAYSVTSSRLALLGRTPKREAMVVAEEEDSLNALEYELNQMGLSVEDLQPPEDGHFDRRAMARVESARIMSRRFIERDKVKGRILHQKQMYRRLMQESRLKKVQAWEQRTHRSPFSIDLLAENERLDEENRVRLKEEERQARLQEKRKGEARNSIILQALSESSDLHALRREKRAIIEEERCLKALMDIEKSSGHRKAQMLAALRAEKQRHMAKADYRRKNFTDALQKHFEKEADVLREKHNILPRSVDTFTAFSEHR